jgi:hypothetical protein
MSHRYHPDPEQNDPPDAKLFDGCERCDEQTNLFGLDRQKLHWFWSAMHQIKRSGAYPPERLTENEYKAINRMYEMAIIFERLTSVWPSPEALFRFSMAENPHEL